MVSGWLGHAGKVITLDVQTWASIATIVAVGLIVVGMLSRKIDKLETRFESAIADVRTDLRVLDDRVYDLSSRRPPAPPRQSGSSQ